jgi:hypothetical protein
VPAGVCFDICRPTATCRQEPHNQPRRSFPSLQVVLNRDTVLSFYVLRTAVKAIPLVRGVWMRPIDSVSLPLFFAANGYMLLLFPRVLPLSNRLFSCYHSSRMLLNGASSLSCMLCFAHWIWEAMCLIRNALHSLFIN